MKFLEVLGGSMFKTRLFVIFLVILSLLAPISVFSQEPPPPPPVTQEPPPVQAEKPTVSTDKKVQKPLDDAENPLMIGKRNINKRQLDFYSLNKEVQLGRQLAAEIDRRGKFVEDPVITEYVNRIGQNVVLHSDTKLAFTIKVLDIDDVNAFAFPGGFLYVTKGLLLATDNEAELAGVMAHEIAHVCARHGVEQASKITIINYVRIVPMILLGGVLGGVASQATDLTAMMGLMKFSRGAEAEADKLGAQYLWAAGYDPNNLISFFEKLEKKEKHKPGTLSKLFGSHPPTLDRIEKVNNLLARFPDRDEYTITTSEFIRVKKRLFAITNTKTLDADGNRDTGPKRPTLKRRKEGDPSTTETQNPTEQKPEDKKDKPTLKRRDSDGKPPDTKPPQN